MKSVPKGSIIAVDTETTGLNVWTGDAAFCVSFCNEEGESCALTTPVDPFTRKPWWSDKPTHPDVVQMRQFFENPAITKVFFNAKFDLRMIQTIAGIQVRGRVEDVFYMTKVLHAAEPTFRLKPLAKKYLGVSDDDEKELHEAVRRARLKGKKLGWKLAEEVPADMWMAPPHILERYATGDAERTMLLYKVLNDELDTAVAYRKFYEREMELLPVTMRMEAYGVRIKPDVVQQEIEKNEKLMEDCLRQLRALISPDFNPNSPQVVAEYFYVKEGLSPLLYTENGNPSTNLDALKGIDHPAVPLIQQYKASQKAISSFFQRFLSLAVEDADGHWVIHPSFNQVGPVTGRFSCNNPNLQNVANATSIRAVVPIQARVGFWPRVEHEWYCFDYSAQEAWIFAAGAQEKRMLEILLAGRDLPGETAVALWGQEMVDEETKRQGGDIKRNFLRIRSKMLLYGLIYGIGVRKLGDLLKVPEREAAETKEKYLQLFPEIANFMTNTINKARRNGYVATAWGRRIPVDSDTAYRAVNYFVQGSAADIMKQAMLEVDWHFRVAGIRAHMIMTVHDELVVEFHKSAATKENILKVKSIMEDHKGHLKGIPCLPAGVARVKKSWNLTEKIKL